MMIKLNNANSLFSEKLATLRLNLQVQVLSLVLLSCLIFAFSIDRFINLDENYLILFVGTEFMNDEDF